MTTSQASLPDLLYSDVEEDLRSAVRDMLTDTAPWSQVLADLEIAAPGPGKIWTHLATNLGCVGLPVSEELGGAGATWREVGVVLEELGRSVSSAPFLTSSVLATALLQAVGGDEHLGLVASGESIAALAVPWASPSGTLTRADSTVRDGHISGTVPLVAGALEADFLLVPTRSGLFLVDAHLTDRTGVEVLDMTRPLADVRLDGVTGSLLADPTATETAFAHAGAVAACLLASEQLGLAEWCLETTVAYLQERRQFGRVLASYQGLKHRLADLWTEIAQARAVARYAAACAAQATLEQPGDLQVAASLAQVVCSRVAQKAAEECVQMHGGIGFTWEHPAHLYLKRARTDALALGSPSYHRGRLGTLVDLPRAPR